MSWHAICHPFTMGLRAPNPQRLQHLVSSVRCLVQASARPTVVDMSTDSENEVSQLRGNRFAVLGESQEGRDQPETSGVDFPARRRRS